MSFVNFSFHFGENSITNEVKKCIYRYSGWLGRFSEFAACIRLAMLYAVSIACKLVGGISCFRSFYATTDSISFKLLPHFFYVITKRRGSIIVQRP
jgi:hypothetical protein